MSNQIRMLKAKSPELEVHSLAFCLGIFCLYAPAAIYLVSTIRLWFGFDVGAGFSLYGGLLIALCGSAYHLRVLGGKSISQYLMLTVAGCLVFISTALFSVQFLDLSFDGQTYQQLGIQLFANGWNPLRDEPVLPTSLGKDCMHYAKFFNHYPTFPWSVGAVFEQSLGTAEWGKNLHLLLILAAFFIWFEFASTLANKRRRLNCLCLAFAVACNPVAITQSLSWYIDGLVGSLFACCLGLSLGLLLSPARHRAFALGVAVTMLANTKFTGALYAAVVCASIGCFLLAQSKQTRSALAVLCLTIALGVSVLGFHPYAKNLLNKGSPFYPISMYPLSGVTPAEEFLMKGQHPANLRQEDRFTKFFLSHFSYSENAAGLQPARLKLPWVLAWREFESFVEPDVRAGGFGPLFPLILCLGAITGLAAALLHPRKGVPLLALAVGVLASALLNPEAWWARYVPQVWLVPILVGGYFILVPSARWIAITSRLLLVLCVANSVLIGSVYFHAQWNRSAEALAQLESLSNSRTEYSVEYSSFRALKKRLLDFGVRLNGETATPCVRPVPLLYTPAVLCPLEVRS